LINLGHNRLKISRNLLALAVLGVALLIAGNYMGPKAKEPPKVPEAPVVSEGLEGYEARLARDLEGVLSQVEGAGQVVVTVSLKAGPEAQMAGNETRTERKTEERDASGGVRVTTETNEQLQLAMARPGGAGESPIEVRTLRPEVGGVLVVCDGARDPQVRASIGQAVQTLLDIPAHRVMVLPRKGGKSSVK
jgi:stage III sporulation protein AG